MSDNEGSYNAWTASALIFNIIVGMGIWALPKMIYESGTIAAVVTLLMSGLLSYIIATYINELQGTSNAIKKLNLAKEKAKVLPEDEINLIVNDESDRLDEATVYAVTERFELSSAVTLILGPTAAKLNNLALMLSLQVALCAYLVTFSETTRNLFCRPLSCQAENYTQTLNEENAMCGENHTEYFMYITFMVIFLFGTAPLCMLNMGDNSYVQFIGTILRWFTILVVLGVSFLHVTQSESPTFSYSRTNWNKVPLMIGLANSAFGCHEALPSVLFPIRSKRNITVMMILTFFMVFVLYMFLTSTAMAAFSGPDIADVFLLNFQNDCQLVSSSILRLFLTSYPIVPATTSFIIFHIVCQRNLRVILSLPENKFKYSSIARHYAEKFGIIFLVSLVPVIVACTAIDVGVIFSFGGAFCSILSSWGFPTLMAFKSRQLLHKVSVENPLASPFQSIFWIILILATILLTITANIIVLIISN